MERERARERESERAREREKIQCVNSSLVCKNEEQKLVPPQKYNYLAVYI